MRSSILFDLAVMGEMLSQKDSVITARNFALEIERDEGARSFLKNLPETALTAAFEPMKDQSIEWKVLYHATRCGEKKGNLGKAWSFAGVLLMLRESLGEKKAPTDSDKRLFCSLCSFFDETAFKDLNWKKWSRDSSWQEMELKSSYPEATNEEVVTWLKSAITSPIELNTAVKNHVKNSEAVRFLTAFGSCLEGFKDSLDL